MPTTSNFGWTTPADTDLVKDGAAAIRTLGNGIDTSFLDLKGGTTGQNLRKASNTDLDFTFAGDATNTVIDAEGDLLVGDSADTLQRLAVGTTGQVLTVDTTLDGKIKWASPAAGSFSGCSLTQSGAQTISNTTQTDLLFANETFDTDGYHSTVTNTNRITIPTGKSGYFLVTARTAFAANTTGTRINWIIKNGTTEISTVYAGAAVSDNTSVVTSAIVSLVAGDYITLNVYQTSGGSLNTVTDQFKTNFAIQYLGA